ncbi:MAG: (Fe-S)-binding protein [Pseudonocardiaceae bacterium]
MARLVIGLGLTLVTLVLAGRRVWWLYALIRSGQPAHGRTEELGARLRTQLVEVFGQRRLLRWTIPGLAHFFTFWGFVVLLTVYIEAYGALFDEHFAIPLIGHWPVLGFGQDAIALAVLASIITFAVMRVAQAPERRQRASRFYGSHTGGAWLILFMIFTVIWTLFLFRGTEVNTGTFPYARGAFASQAAGALLGGSANHALETVGLLLHIGVMLAFLIIVLYSKHLHIFIAPINVATKRLPKALGPLLPMESGGKEIDFEDPGEDDVFGRGKVEDFTWKGLLDFATCTECGRCQSQCPAWNTGKPLSPKLVIMDLRDHLFAKAPYLIGDQPVPDHSDVDVLALAGRNNQRQDSHHVPESGFGRVPGSGPEQATRPLVGTAEVGGVIDPDVLWSCTTCGACVEQCPVDIEHVDHIVDMRRYQVLIEAEFPTELGTLFRNLENKGNPWGQSASARMDWAKGLDFEVPQLVEETLPDDVEYLFWIGCAGAYDDNARKTVRATAELLHHAGVNYVVLGDGETCTGDPARRSGNEFVFQLLARQNVEVLNTVFDGRAPGRRKIVTTCPHCFNTLGREYPQLDGHYEVVHHTQLLNQLVRERKLVPVPPADGPAVTYHDPCYLGRHNEVYSPPRELLGASGTRLTEMPRHAERSMCCGAGGARMWMEERIGKRVNLDRVDEAIATGTSAIATGCPFCRVMLTDGLTTREAEGTARTTTQVVDVAQLLLASIKRGSTPPLGSE